MWRSDLKHFYYIIKLVFFLISKFVFRDSVNESDEEIYEGSSEPPGNQTTAQTLAQPYSSLAPGNQTTAQSSVQPSSSSTTADQRRLEIIQILFCKIKFCYKLNYWSINN